MDRYFWKKVGLDFGRTFLGFYAVTIAATFASSLANVEAGDFSAASWKGVGVAAAVGAASAAIRAAQALWTNLESDVVNRPDGDVRR